MQISIRNTIDHFRGCPDRLNEDEQDLIVLALETVEDLLRYGKTATWERTELGPGYFTPGGNSPYHCSACGYDVGANEIFPSKKICPGCRALMKNGRRKR